MQPSDTEKGEDEVPLYTFKTELNRNSVIKNTLLEISQLREQADNRVNLYMMKWQINSESGDKSRNRFRWSIWNPKDRMWVDKLLEKEQSVLMTESVLEGYKRFLTMHESEEEEMKADFIKIEFTKVKKIFVSHVRERISSVGKILAKSAEKEVEELQNVIF